MSILIRKRAAFVSGPWLPGSEIPVPSSDFVFSRPRPAGTSYKDLPSFLYLGPRAEHFRCHGEPVQYCILHMSLRCQKYNKLLLKR